MLVGITADVILMESEINRIGDKELRSDEKSSQQSNPKYPNLFQI